MAQLGRIGGHLLEQNLKRDNVDLKFSNTTFDSTSLLYLSVTDGKVGIRNDAPYFDLDISTDIRSTDVSVDDYSKLDNIIIRSNGTISTIVGPLYINQLNISDTGTYYFDRLESDELYFTDNIIGTLDSNSSVTLQASGTGTVDVTANTNIYGDLAVTGNITIDGDLTTAGTVILGDEEIDVIVINPDLTQDILPGKDLTHELGQQANDSTARKWLSLHTPDLTNVVTNRPYSSLVSDQLYINGVTNEIFGAQSDDFVELNPDTGITFIEDTKWQANDITNLNGTTPLKFGSTGAGYLRFMGTNAVRIPGGGDASRPSKPELADLRWNTDRQYLEAFAGEIDNVSFTGGLSGLADQIQYPVSQISTSGIGTGADFRFTLVSGVLSIEITTKGVGYNVGDTLLIPGTVFVGGASPLNDITITVGSQTGDGYRRSTGGGEEVNEPLMEQLAVVYDLMLG